MVRVKHEKRANKKSKLAKIPKSRKSRTNQQLNSTKPSPSQPQQFVPTPRALNDVVRVVDYKPEHSFGTNEPVNLKVQRYPGQSSWNLSIRELRRYFPQAQCLSSLGRNVEVYHFEVLSGTISLPSTEKVYQAIYLKSDTPLQFSIHDASSSPYVQESIRFANGLMTTLAFNRVLKKVSAPQDSATFRKKVVELLPRVSIEFCNPRHPEFKHCWAWTKDTLGYSNTEIFLCEYFCRQFDRVRPGTREWKTMVFFVGVCILHEAGHLLQRWNGEKDTPPMYIEGGEFVEQRLFSGVFSVAAAFENVKTKPVGNDLSLEKNPYIDGLLFKKDHEPLSRVVPSYIEKLYDQLVTGRQKLFEVPDIELELKPFREGPLPNGDYGVNLDFYYEPCPVPRRTQIFATRPNMFAWSIAGEPIPIPLAPDLLDLTKNQGICEALITCEVKTSD